jgi:hypothetical protein
MSCRAVLGANPAGNIDLGVNFPGGGKTIGPFAIAPAQQPAKAGGSPAEAPTREFGISQVENPGRGHILKTSYKRRSLLQSGLFDPAFSLDQLLQTFYPYPVLNVVMHWPLVDALLPGRPHNTPSMYSNQGICGMRRQKL